MARIFKRGELREALVAVLATLGEAHGYAIMKELEQRVGGGWKSSPGAIYPALVVLTDTGHVAVTENDGTRLYSLTELGHRAARQMRTTSRWAALGRLAENAPERIATGTLLDRFADGSAVRRRLANPTQQQQIAAVLADAEHEITRILDQAPQGEEDG